MHYEPSSPRAPPQRSFSQAPRAHPASASVHAGSKGDAQQTRVPTRTDSTRNDSMRSEHTGSDQMRSATSRVTYVAPAIHTLTSGQRSQAWRSHAREPRATSASQGEKSLSHQSHNAASPRRGKTSSHIFCGNNILSPKLRRNGGDMDIGSPSQCFRKGFGAAFYQEIEPAHLEEFLVDNSGPYQRYIEQPLFYKDGSVPPGEFRATLSQCRSRGFGVGAVQRAKKILKERKHGVSKA